MGLVELSLWHSGFACATGPQHSRSRVLRQSLPKRELRNIFHSSEKAQGELDLCFLRSAAWLSYIRSLHDIASSDPLTAIYWSFFKFFFFIFYIKEQNRIDLVSWKVHWKPEVPTRNSLGGVVGDVSKGLP